MLCRNVFGGEYFGDESINSIKTEKPAMRIGIEARTMNQESRGIGRFTREIVNALLRVDRENEYFLFMNGHAEGLQ